MTQKALLERISQLAHKLGTVVIVRLHSSVNAAYLEPRDGALPGLGESLIDPGDDGVIDDLLTVTQLLQDVQSVPDVRWKVHNVKN